MKHTAVAAPPTTDVTVENHGSLVLFRPHTDAARTWVEDHVDDGAQWFGGALVVEPRYAMPFTEALMESGFIVA